MLDKDVELQLSSQDVTVAKNTAKGVDLSTAKKLTAKIGTLTTTVGDSKSGLVKQVADNKTAIAGKANSSDITNQLGKKADKSVVDSLSGVVGSESAGLVKDVADIKANKADKSALNAKADKTTVDGKADKTELAKKADSSALDAKADKTELAKKADTTALNTKANKTDLDKKADKSALDALITRVIALEAANKPTE